MVPGLQSLFDFHVERFVGSNCLVEIRMKMPGSEISKLERLSFLKNVRGQI